MKRGPIFLGYVFVNVVPSADAFVGLLSIRHVRSILGDGESPVHVRAENINLLRELIDGDLLDAEERKLMPGDRVEINHGPFAFVEAVVKSHRKAGRIECMAQLFGGEVPVEVPLANLQRIG